MLKRLLILKMTYCGSNNQLLLKSTASTLPDSLKITWSKSKTFRNFFISVLLPIFKFYLSVCRKSCWFQSVGEKKDKPRTGGDSSIHRGSNPETIQLVKLWGVVYTLLCPTHTHYVQIQPSASPVLFRLCIGEWTDAEGKIRWLDSTGVTSEGKKGNQADGPERWTRWTDSPSGPT